MKNSPEGASDRQGADDPGCSRQIRAQVSRIMRSPDFAVSDRARKFFAYVVDETLIGRADRVKAYSIATEVLGRDASFDGAVDPVVRIEGGRIRRALDLYYLKAGASDPIIITIPKGGYVATFTRRDHLPKTLGPSCRASGCKRGETGWAMARRRCRCRLEPSCPVCGQSRLPRWRLRTGPLDIPARARRRPVPVARPHMDRMFLDCLWNPSETCPVLRNRQLWQGA